jgi:hypothetical protein
LEQQLRSALADGADEYSIRWRLARLQHFRAMQLQSDNELSASQQAFAQGREEAQRAVALQPSRAEGHVLVGL